MRLSLPQLICFTGDYPALAKTGAKSFGTQYHSIACLIFNIIAVPLPVIGRPAGSANRSTWNKAGIQLLMSTIARTLVAVSIVDYRTHS